jgi:hypothetical protein
MMEDTLWVLEANVTNEEFGGWTTADILKAPWVTSWMLFSEAFFLLHIH